MKGIDGNTTILIGPNASLSRRWAWVAFGWIAFVTTVISTTFLFLGLWPILPWAGLEVGAFGVALWIAQRGNRYREVLTFEGDDLRVEIGMVGRGVLAQLHLKRPLTRVLIEPNALRNHPTRLLLSCCGQRVELGRCLTDAERETLAQRLRQLIHPGWIHLLHTRRDPDEWPFIETERR